MAFRKKKIRDEYYDHCFSILQTETQNVFSTAIVRSLGGTKKRATSLVAATGEGILDSVSTRPKFRRQWKYYF